MEQIADTELSSPLKFYILQGSEFRGIPLERIFLSHGIAEVTLMIRDWIYGLTGHPSEIPASKKIERIMTYPRDWAPRFIRCGTIGDTGRSICVDMNSPSYTGPYDILFSYAKSMRNEDVETIFEGPPEQIPGKILGMIHHFGIVEATL